MERKEGSQKVTEKLKVFFIIYLDESHWHREVLKATKS